MAVASCRRLQRSWLLLAVLLCTQLVVAAEKQGARTGSRTSVDRNASTRMALGVLVILLVLCGSGIGWCLYLECKPGAKPVRFILLVMLGIITFIDILLCVFQYFFWWMLPVTLLINTWGALDATLRFPVVHGVGTAFSCKQMLLLVLRGLTYLVGIQNFAANGVTFVAVIIANVIAAPLMYLLALPLDEMISEQDIAASDVVDVDIAVRAWRIAVDPRSRREFTTECKRRLRLLAASFAEICPPAGQVICYFDPKLRRSIQKTVRAV